MKNKLVITLLTCVIIASFIIATVPVLAAPVSQTPPKVTVAAGETWVVPVGTTKLTDLTIEPGATITAPEGYSVTMTVNGVETGQKLIPMVPDMTKDPPQIYDTFGVDTYFVPGTYHGNIVLTVAETNIVNFALPGPPGTLPATYPFRQALYLDSTGVVNDYSVLSAVVGQKPNDNSIKNIQISSTGEDFNGIYVAGGNNTITNAKIDFNGNGRSDFAGYGAAVEADGTGTTLVLDNANIKTQGVVRTGVVATNGSHVIVKNSNIQTMDGVLPNGYIGTPDQSQMMSVPWVLSLSGNCRATNLLGNDTFASYINSSISAEGWGVLSTDSGQDCQLTAIDSKIAITGQDGYGSYAIGNAIERFLGCEFDVGTYATINRGGDCYYGDSTPEAVAELNTSLGLGLTAKELAKLPDKPTIINSNRFGFMWHGSGSATIDGGTIVNTNEATFLDKGQAITVNVDGSQGAQLNPANGILFQLMDDDDPGAQPPYMWFTGTYVQPTGPVTPDTGHNIYTATSNDAVVTFSNINLSGNFYNGTRGGEVAGGPGGPGGSISRNLDLTFNNTNINGIITSSDAVHNQSPITYPEVAPLDYLQLGEVHNVVGPAVNNGVIVTLNSGSNWTVTDTSYLTGLTIASDATVTAPSGYSVTMTVDGTPTDIVPGTTYTGDIVLTVTAD